MADDRRPPRARPGVPRRALGAGLAALAVAPRAATGTDFARIDAALGNDFLRLAFAA